MKNIKLLMDRIYLTESEKIVKTITNYLIR